MVFVRNYQSVIKKKDLSQEDKKAWEEYVNNPSDIYDKENSSHNISKKKSRFKFDLHGFSLDGANNKVKEIILSCMEKKYSEIISIIENFDDKDLNSGLVGICKV